MEQELKQIDPYKFVSFRRYFLTLWKAYQQTTGKTNATGFGRCIGVTSKGIAPQLVNGVRNLTPFYAELVGKTLNHPKKNIDYLIAMANYENAPESRGTWLRKLVKLQIDRVTISDERGQFVKSWLPSALLEMAQIAPLDAETVSSLRSVFKLDAEEFNGTLKALARLGLLENSSAGYKYTGKGFFDTTDELLKVMLMQTMLDSASEALALCPQEERNFKMATFKVSKDRVNEFRRMVDEFVQKIVDEEDQGEDADRVYQLNVQLFPLVSLTKPKS